MITCWARRFIEQVIGLFAFELHSSTAAHLRRHSTSNLQKWRWRHQNFPHTQTTYRLYEICDVNYSQKPLTWNDQTYTCINCDWSGYVDISYDSIIVRVNVKLKYLCGWSVVLRFKFICWGFSLSMKNFQIVVKFRKLIMMLDLMFSKICCSIFTSRTIQILNLSVLGNIFRVS